MYALSAAGSIGVCHTTCYITVQQILGGLVWMLWPWHHGTRCSDTDHFDLPPSSIMLIRVLAGVPVCMSPIVQWDGPPNLCAYEFCLGQVQPPCNPHATPMHLSCCPRAAPLAVTPLERFCREKKLAAKAQGRRHASSDEDESEEEAAEEGEGASAGEEDPFFQHEDNPFDDPFFRVRSHARCHYVKKGVLSDTRLLGFHNRVYNLAEGPISLLDAEIIGGGLMFDGGSCVPPGQAVSQCMWLSHSQASTGLPDL